MPIIYVNQVGGQDELVFDGGSVAVGSAGHVACRAGAFDEGLHAVDVLFDELDVEGVAPFVFAATVNPSVEVTLKCGHHTVIST